MDEEDKKNMELLMVSMARLHAPLKCMPRIERSSFMLNHIKNYLSVERDRLCNECQEKDDAAKEQMEKEQKGDIRPIVDAMDAMTRYRAINTIYEIVSQCVNTIERINREEDMTQHKGLISIN